MKLHRDPAGTPAAVQNILNALAGNLAHGAEETVRNIEFIPLDGEPGVLRVTRRDENFTVSYGTPLLAARGIAHVLAGTECSETCAFSRFGVLTDWTAGRVPQLSALKKQILQFALLGYGETVIHLADNLFFPEEPASGICHGRFSGAELKEASDFASGIGTELAFSLDVSAIHRSALEKTFALLAGQLHVSRLFIDPGRGLSGNAGAATVKQILAEVLDLCRKYAVTPVFWSDTPRGIDTGKELFAVIQRENAPVAECKCASAGIPSDCGFWTSAERTEAMLSARLQACRKAETAEVIITLRNALSVPESDLAALAWCADCCFGQNHADMLFSAVTGMDYALVRKFGQLGNGTALPGGHIPMELLLKDTPLAGEFGKLFAMSDPAELKKLLVLCCGLKQQTESLREEHPSWNLAWNLCSSLSAVLELRLVLGRAYAKHDFQLLETVSGRYIPALLDALEGLEESFRSAWLAANQPFGTETYRIPLAVLISEYGELGRWIDEFTEGETDTIPFLDRTAPSL